MRLSKFCLVLVASTSFSGLACGQAKGGGKTPPKSPPARPSDAIHDVGTNTFGADWVDDAKLAGLDADLKALKDGAALSWENTPNAVGQSLFNLVAQYLTAHSEPSSCTPIVSVQQSFVFHVAHWVNTSNPPADSPPVFVSSDWYVYRHPRWKKKGDTTLIPADLTGAGDPLIYGASQMLIVGIDRFDNGTAGKLSVTYSTTVTQGVPANWTDLGALIAGLGGMSAQSLGAISKLHSAYIGASCQRGTAALPFNIAIAKTAAQDPNVDPSKGGAPQSPNPGTVACSGQGNTTPCSMNRSFTSQDHEYWDVSIGIATPGLRETSYSFSNATNSVLSSVTTHTEAYGLLDIFPFASVMPKESIAPHFAVGIPVSSKSLYRPFFGMAQNLTGWTHLQKKLSLPVGINFLAGMGFMKTQQIEGAPMSQAQFQSALTYHRVWKPMFGFEVPVASALSKLGKGGSSKNANGSAKTGN